MKYLYIVYQYLIAWPIFVVITIFTALFTILLVPFRNSEFVHKEQQFWSRSAFWLMFLPVSVDGQEHIQKGQSYVFVANHQSMFDVWLVYGWLPVIFKWLMKAELQSCRTYLREPPQCQSSDGESEKRGVTTGERCMHRHLPGRHPFVEW